MIDAKLKVGQEIFIERMNNAARNNTDIIETTISKVGKKYFEVDGLMRARFYIETMIQDGGDYTPNYRAYLSKQEILDKEEKIKLRWDISEKIKHGNISLEQLRQINKIIFNEQ